MPQTKIPLTPGHMYHVWTHANGSENLFRSEENYGYFLKKYAHYIQPVADTFAYCLMPNHLHLMIRVREEGELKTFFSKSKPALTLQGFETLGGFSTLLSKQFSHLFNAYTQAFNKQHKRKGSLFTPNFHRKHINTEAYFTQLIAYIHHNAVHHGFVNHPADWPYSSWHAYLLQKNTKILKEEGLEWFGGREAFVNFHQAWASEKWAGVFEVN